MAPGNVSALELIARGQVAHTIRYIIHIRNTYISKILTRCLFVVFYNIANKENLSMSNVTDADKTFILFILLVTHTVTFSLGYATLKTLQYFDVPFKIHIVLTLIMGTIAILVGVKIIMLLSKL